MKKIVIALLATLAIGGSLVGCGEESKPASGNNPATSSVENSSSISSSLSAADTIIDSDKFKESLKSALSEIDALDNADLNSITITGYDDFGGTGYVYLLDAEVNTSSGTLVVSATYDSDETWEITGIWDKDTQKHFISTSDQFDIYDYKSGKLITPKTLDNGKPLSDSNLQVAKKVIATTDNYLDGKITLDELNTKTEDLCDDFNFAIGTSEQTLKLMDVSGDAKNIPYEIEMYNLEIEYGLSASKKELDKEILKYRNNIAKAIGVDKR